MFVECAMPNANSITCNFYALNRAYANMNTKWRGIKKVLNQHLCCVLCAHPATRTHTQPATYATALTNTSTKPGAHVRAPVLKDDACWKKGVAKHYV